MLGMQPRGAEEFFDNFVPCDGGSSIPVYLRLSFKVFVNGIVHQTVHIYSRKRESSCTHTIGESERNIRKVREHSQSEGTFADQ